MPSLLDVFTGPPCKLIYVSTALTYISLQGGAPQVPGFFSAFLSKELKVFFKSFVDVGPGPFLRMEDQYGGYDFATVACIAALESKAGHQLAMLSAGML